MGERYYQNGPPQPGPAPKNDSMNTLKKLVREYAMKHPMTTAEQIVENLGLDVHPAIVRRWYNYGAKKRP